MINLDKDAKQIAIETLEGYELKTCKFGEHINSILDKTTPRSYRGEEQIPLKAQPRPTIVPLLPLKNQGVDASQSTE